MKRIIDEGKPPRKPSRTSILAVKQRQRERALQIKTILVPLDFSPASLQALKYTIPLAKEFGSTVHLVHVQPVDELTAIENAGGLMLNCADAIALMQDRLSEALSTQGGFWPDNCHVVSGRPFEEICKLAGRIEANLIVLPTRGLGRLKHVLLGSTAERVVRYASCPVLIPHGAGFKSITWNGNSGMTGFKLRKILVPVDFSPCSMAGVRYAARLASTTGGTLRLFHVVFPYTQVFALDRVGADLTPLATTAKATAREQMKELTGMNFLRDIPCETQIQIGRVIDEIVGESGDPAIDLVVTSTHGTSGFKRAFIGSVAEQVVRYANCPVMTVPSRGCP
jgi:nucleotide-binding universal stress UspA family protein